MLDLALVADIGATNARFALIVPGGHEIVSPLVLRCADFPGLAEAALAYLRRAAPEARPRLAAIDVAGPVLGDVVELTNHPWRIEIPSVRAALGLDRIEVINDFAAVAHAVPLLGPEDRIEVRDGVTDAVGPIAVLGPGTGLGVAAVVPTESGWLPIATEGGHVSLAADGERDAAVLDWLRARFGHVSAERALSGPGLVNLYDAVCALAKQPAQPLSPEEVGTRALAGEALPMEALDVFFAMLGGFAGDLALAYGARGGVTIAGGVVPRFLPLLAKSAFARRFVDKGRLRYYLETIPVRVVTHPLPALIGLAGLLADVNAESSPRRIARRSR